MITFLENYTLPFRHWVANHESLLLGGSLGFFHSGPIGLLIGAWLGNYISEKIQSTTQQVQRATQVVQPIVAPFSFMRGQMQNLWQLTQTGYQASKNWMDNIGQPNVTLALPRQQDSQKPTIKDIQKADKGQPTLVEANNKGHPTTKDIQKADSQQQAAPSGPSILQTAGELFDMINGHADDSVVGQYGDSWLTRDISELPALMVNQFRGLTQRFWQQPSQTPQTNGVQPDTPESRVTPR